MSNPFSLSFGKKPVQYISRIKQTNEIINAFTAEPATNQIFMLTGVRGSGKTVMMTNISQALAKNEEWITIELNPERDLLQSFAAKLYSEPGMYPLFMKAKIDLSAFGIGVSIEGAPPVADIESAIELMLQQVKKKGKKVLVCIDEVTKSENIKVFSMAFQIFIRGDYPLFLLMTGLYENLYSLQNEKTLTFLYRAPKVVLEPLNFTAVRESYREIFKISTEQAESMTYLTKGYPFAYQVLGYLCWEREAKESLDRILVEYDQYLAEYVYDKIWSELSMEDKKITRELAKQDAYPVKELREKLDITSEKLSVYRERLKRKGIIDTSTYGVIKLALPRFSEFVDRTMSY